LKEKYEKDGFQGLKKSDDVKKYDSNEVFSSFFGGDENHFASMGFNDSNDFKSRKKEEVVAKVEEQQIDLPCSLFEICHGAEKRVKVYRKGYSEHTSKYFEDSKLLTIDIKQGVEYGETIKVEKEGDQEKDHEAADIVFTIRKDPKDNFERIDSDLVYIHRLTLVEALTGCFIQIPTAERDANIVIAVNEVIHPKYERRIFGRGVPMLGNPDKRGDLVIKFDIVFPKSLSLAKKKSARKFLS
jgi:DnaJ-class molecular chaperone